MNRAQLLAELGAYQPVDGREREMVADVIDFIRANADSFTRTCVAGHITASAWVIDEDHSHALLTHHRKLGRWLQLGGHADGDEDVRRVALREASEESGLTAMRFAADSIYDVDVHSIPARHAEPAHKHYDIRFVLVADRAAPLVVSEESHDLAWLAIASLDAGDIDPSVRRLVQKTANLPASRTPP